jgi:magnesium transporter
MLKYYEIIVERLTETSNPKSPILVYIDPDENEKKYLINDLLIDENTLHSALDPNELSLLEFEPQHTAVIFKRPKNYSAKDQLLFKPTTVGVFFFSDKLIIVMPENITLFDGKVFSKVNSLTEVMLKLLYRSIRHFTEHLKVINMISDDIERKINRAMENKHLINLFTLQKSLVYYVDAISSNGGVLEKIKNYSSKLGFNQEQIELLDDIIIENNQCNIQAQNYSDILASLMDARASIVSNNLNILIKILNIITIAIMVPSLVVSIFSMNVKLPIGEHPNAFWIVCGLAGVSVMAVLLLWRALKL